MMDFGKGIIEMMEERFPLLIRFGLPKAHGMGFEGIPFHKQQVTVRDLDAA